MLLDAGADPNDNESLYHSTENPDLTCMQLLLQGGARVEDHPALNSSSRLRLTCIAIRDI
jgi:hypothetical protein